MQIESPPAGLEALEGAEIFNYGHQPNAAAYGRSPLYRLERFLANRDVELLVGEDLPANAFNDVNVGRSLDTIFEAGPSKIVTALGVRATGTFALDTNVPSYDTTSTSHSVC